jgi:hypothetical protein
VQISWPIVAALSIVVGATLALIAKSLFEKYVFEKGKNE